MSSVVRRLRLPSRPQWLALLVLGMLAGGGMLPALAQTPADAPRPVHGANFKQAYKYSNEFLRQFVYSTSVTPIWIGKSDSFWYQYTTSKGKQWYRVHPHAVVKEPLFNRVKLGAQLSELRTSPSIRSSCRSRASRSTTREPSSSSSPARCNTNTT